MHVLVTSYEMASAELRELKHLEWEVLCVDEGHRLKNRESLLFKVLHMPSPGFPHLYGMLWQILQPPMQVSRQAYMLGRHSNCLAVRLRLVACWQRQ